LRRSRSRLFGLAGAYKLRPFPAWRLSRKACRVITNGPRFDTEVCRAQRTKLIDRGRRTILRRAIAPATAALQYMDNAADDPTIVRPLDAPNIRRQARFDPLPLLIAQPKQVSAHDPNPLPKTNQDRIVRAEKLMSSDPSRAACACFSVTSISKNSRFGTRYCLYFA